MKDQRAVLFKELNAHGIRGEVMNGGKHEHVRWRIPGCPERLMVLSRGTGTLEPRALLNLRANVRRLLREDGVFDKVVQPKPTQLQKALEPGTAIDPLYMRVRRLEEQLEALTELYLEHAIQPVQVGVVVNGKPMVVQAVADTPKVTEPKAAKAAPRSREVPTLRDRVIRALDYQRPKKAADIAKELNKDVKVIATYLSVMFRDGVIQKLGRGEYRKAPIA